MHGHKKSPRQPIFLDKNAPLLGFWGCFTAKTRKQIYKDKIIPPKKFRFLRQIYGNIFEFSK